MKSLKCILEASILGNVEDTLASGAKDIVLSNLLNLKNSNSSKNALKIMRELTANETFIKNINDLAKMDVKDIAIAIDSNDECMVIIKKHTKSEYFIKCISCGSGISGGYMFSRFGKIKDLKYDIKYVSDKEIRLVKSKENIDICQAIIDKVEN